MKPLPPILSFAYLRQALLCALIGAGLAWVVIATF